MKKSLLIAMTGLISIFSFGQTATDFTATDCSSNSHNLFTELNAGKVVVICWVMPCSACINAASTDGNTVFSMSNPNVVFYLVDDAGNTSCGSLTGWATTNSITTNAAFGNASTPINMADYGTSGMPKTVVLGGSTHQIFYNQNGTVSQSALQTAINNALATGINEPKATEFGLKAFPNPAVNNAKIDYTLSSSVEVNIDVINMLGEKVNSVSLGKIAAGKQEYQLNVESLKNGIYFVKLNAGKDSETIKVTVAH